MRYPEVIHSSKGKGSVLIFHKGLLKKRPSTSLRGVLPFLQKGQDDAAIS